MKICLDSNIIIPIFIKEVESNSAYILFNKIESHKNIKIIMPAFSKIENYSVFAKKYSRGDIDMEHLQSALAGLNGLNIHYYQEHNDLLKEALNIAIRLKQLSIYDSIYLALAIKNDCSFISVDAKFIKLAKNIYSKCFLLKDSIDAFYDIVNDKSNS